MIRLLLVLALVGVGSDALYNNGAYTQRTFYELSTQVDKLASVVGSTSASTVAE